MRHLQVAAVTSNPYNCRSRSSPVTRHAPLYNRTHMKAHVFVTLKRTVLDAQGQTVADALRRMRYQGVSDVRQGKYFLLTLDETPEAQASAEVDRIAVRSSSTPSSRSTPSASNHSVLAPEEGLPPITIRMDRGERSRSTRPSIPF